MKKIGEVALTEKERNHRFYERHRTEELARNAAYSKLNAESIARRVRLVKHRMTQEEHDALMLKQENVCAICKKPFTKTPHIDHNHGCCPDRLTCGKCNRGLLCDDCNLGLGRFKDNVVFLRNAIEYLGAYNGRQSYYNEPERIERDR